MPQASVLTPNLFEAEQLAGIAIHSEAEAFEACSLLHARGPHTVVRPTGGAACVVAMRARVGLPARGSVPSDRGAGVLRGRLR